MSASREAIAEASGVPVEKCSCQDCARSAPYLWNARWCKAWDAGTNARDYCSFFVPEGKDGDGDG